MIIKRFISEVIDFFRQIYINRNLIYELTRRDFTKKYVRNFFGLTWTILDPLSLIVVLFFVFSMRFGSKDALGGASFIAYLLCAYISFQFFTQTLQQVTSSIKDYSFLLKKINFRVAIIPMVKILSSVVVHMIVLGLALIILMIDGNHPNWYWFQSLYYILAAISLLLALGWITSSVSLFFPDLTIIINLLVRIFFFITPIFWNIQGLPEKYAFYLKFNPLFYIVNGYRESLLYNTGFWQHPRVSAYYWGLTLIVMIIGIIVFRKLRPHFADVTD